MKINCVSCGHKIELDNAYSDYEGRIRCFTCGALLEIKTEEGGIRWVKVAQWAVGAAGGEHPSHEDSPRLESLVK
jgi:DNA-directed RNA polymerase subunit RPC12/RpoP